jgi:class 3 adenylate cyclase
MSADIDAPTREHTFLFADLAGFTALTEAHGDEDAAELAGDYSEQVRKLLPDHDADLVKTIGDAVMVRVAKADAAVDLGLRIVHELGARHGAPPVRVGIHTGPAVERAGDWYGATVNIAARVSGLAAGGEVLVTAATRSAAGDPEGVEFRARGSHELKNVREPVLVHAASRTAARDDEGLEIDPVCRMSVDPGRAAGKLVYEGDEYCFCSLECAARFASSPSEYTRSG